MTQDSTQIKGKTYKKSFDQAATSVPEKYTFLIVHGWSQDQTMQQRWQALIKLLTRQGHQARYLQLPGFETKLNKSWNLNDYASWLATQLKNEKKPCVVIGHSFGGQIACRFASGQFAVKKSVSGARAAQSKQLNNLAGLVLIGPAGIIDKSLPKKLKRNSFKIFAKLGKRLVSSRFEQPAKKILYKFARATDYQQASSILKTTMAQVLQDEVLTDLPKITVPTLIIWGEQDNFTPVKHADIFKQKITNSQLVLIPHEGHRPYYTQPKLVFTHIKQFLTNVV